MNAKVLFAVFKRNLVSYFASPTGYVFICVFVVLSGLVAFFPPDFFSTNRANLDQLNYWFPFIMLIFIPAITMSVWAEERQQGTDELLLTIPASDFDIVLGKYSAAVAIYSVSLLFSLVCNYWVLAFLGDPDRGLFISTYFGYWLTGLAMLAVGMAASFFTRNLTVAFVLGALMNAPLVLAVWAQTIFERQLAMTLKAWSISAQLAGFGRGIISSGGLVFFLVIMGVMLYVSMVLIGRRLWHGGQITLSDAVFYPLGIITWLAGAAVAARLVSLVFWPSWVHFLITFLVLAVVVTLGLILYVTQLQGTWFPRRLALTPLHYAVRVLSLMVAGACLIGLSQIQAFNVGLDCTSERLSTLSSDTVKLLKNLDPKNPVYVEAFISEDVPELYVQTRLELLAMLQQLDVRGGKNVRLRINDTQRFTDQAERADTRYGITHRRVWAESRGVAEEEDIYMAVAFTCGLEKVVLPFIDRGIPIEYELVRSISTVIQQERRKIGILQTDAPLRGRFNMQAMSSSRDWPIIAELEKQYEVEEVDPSSPITEKYHALLAVQPSSLGPEQMENFLAAVRGGQATAIFEDPFPFFASSVPGTSEPRRPPGGMNPFMRQPPQPKGSLVGLWRLLQIDFSENRVVWQDYNPYPKMSRFDEVQEFVFADAASGAEEAFSDSDPIAAGLQHMLFPFPGAISKLNVSRMEFTPLVKTGTETGTVAFDDLLYRPLGFIGPQDINPRRRQIPGNIPYILAARIKGRAPDTQFGSDGDDEFAAGNDGAEKGGKAAEIDIVLVADIDMLTEPFFRLREQGEIPGAGIHFDFDNVTFVLNALDSLADDDRFIKLRKRRPKHRSLTRIDELMEDARKATRKARKEQQEKVDEAQRKEQQILDDEIEKLRADMEERAVSVAEIRNRIGMKQKAGQRRLDAKIKELQQQRDKEIDEIGTRRKEKVRRLQDRYKLMAVVLPPMPPLALALIVFFTRRSREREGVARTRLRS